MLNITQVVAIKPVFDKVNYQCERRCDTNSE